MNCPYQKIASECRINELRRRPVTLLQDGPEVLAEFWILSNDNTSVGRQNELKRRPGRQTKAQIFGFARRKKSS